MVNDNLNQSIRSILVFGAFVAVLGYSIFITDFKQTTLTTNKQCQLNELLSCHFNVSELNNEQVIVNFSEKVQLEEQNPLTLTLPENLILSNIWVQGVNMYMGKTAVIEQHNQIQKNDNIYNLMFFIGSCSEPHMRWQLIIELNNKVTHKTERYFVNFSTDLP